MRDVGGRFDSNILPIFLPILLIGNFGVIFLIKTL